MKKIGLAVLLLLWVSTLGWADNFTFGVICDTRSNASASWENAVNVAAVRAVCQQMKKANVQFVIAPGDFMCGNVSWYGNTVPSNDLQYQTFLRNAATQGVGLPGSKQPITLYPVRGNHECYHDLVSLQEVKDAWTRNMGKYLPQNGPQGEVGFSYSFKVQNTLFVATDQYMVADDKEKTNIKVNQPWLDSVLKANPTGQVFVFGHTPAFAAKHQDCLGAMPANRDAFLQSIYQRSGSYFCGHDHFYARAKIPVYGSDGKTKIGSMQQVITPSGAPFLEKGKKWDGNYTSPDVFAETYIDNVLGFQLVTVTDTTVNVKYMATQDGCYFDQNKNYTYTTNWQDWQFVVMDQYTYTIGKKTEEQPAGCPCDCTMKNSESKTDETR